MIADRAMYDRALRVLRGLEAKIKDGTATDAERERYHAGCDHVLIYEWAGDPSPAVEVIPREPEPEPPPRAPEAVAFANWYERARRFERFAGVEWFEAALWWWGARDRAALSALWLDMDDELIDRGLHAWQQPQDGEREEAA